MAAGLHAQTSPNLLIIIADDFGVDQVGCYGRGSAPPPTPNIDQLAASGVRFTRAYANPVCSATRATIMTGNHGFRTGLTNSLWLNQPGLNQRYPTFASILHNQGYETGLVGKWHLGVTYGLATPNVLGFSYFAGAMEGAIPDYWSWPRVENGTIATSQNYATSQEVDDALAWIAGQTRQWALMLSFHAPHTPYHEPPAALHTQNLAGLDPQVTPLPFYRAMVEAMDTEIGRLFAQIDPTVLADTNIVFLGDNGSPDEIVQPPFLPDHAKATVYEGGVNVPLIVAGPAVASPGHTCTALVNTVDLYPTIFELCGVASSSIPANAGHDGQSIVPHLSDAEAAGRSTAYVEITGFANNAIAVIGQRYKLIRLRGAQMQEDLFDLETDPQELNDLLLQPLSPEATAAYQQLQTELATLRPPGTMRPFGTGCAGAGGVPRLTGVIPPQVGLRAGAMIDNLSSEFRLVLGLLGTSNSSYSGTPLPMELTRIGMPGCELLIDAGELGHARFGSGFWPVQIPREPTLAGRTFYMQAFVWEPWANPANMIASGAIEATIGV